MYAGTIEIKQTALLVVLVGHCYTHLYCMPASLVVPFLKDFYPSVRYIMQSCIYY